MIILCLVAIAFVLGAIFWPYRLGEYDGDGTIEDFGFWSYPRYLIQFSPISANEAATYEFRFSGLPPTPLSFSLETVGTGDDDVLDSLATHVEVRLTDESGVPVGIVAQPLHAWELMWIPAYESGEYYDQRLRELSFSRRGTYTLTITVSAVDANSPPLELRPMLDGGGNELP